MKTYLFNPFKFIAGYKALMLGLGAMLITAIACLLLKQHLDGVIDVHTGRETASYIYFIEPVIDWLCLVIPLYIFGRSFSTSSIRLIDVAGTGALARYPILFVVLLNTLSPSQPHDPKKLIDNILSQPILLMKIILLAFIILPFLVWTVALMYNAYSISTNLKGAKAIWTFIASFLIAEILSKVIIYAVM